MHGFTFLRAGAYKRALKLDGKNHDACWRLARALVDQSMLETDDAKKKLLLVEAQDFARWSVRLDANDPKTFDADGLAVAPGFVDIHSHADWLLTLPDHDQILAPMVAQGITTVVAGNCGGSGAPGARKHAHGSLRSLGFLCPDGRPGRAPGRIQAGTERGQAGRITAREALSKEIPLAKTQRRKGERGRIQDDVGPAPFLGGFLVPPACPTVILTT